MGQREWDVHYLRMANLLAEKSKDRSTKNGCVIVGPHNEVRTTGYNGICRGLDDEIEERHTRPIKYFYFEHSERNAVYNAARHGISLDGCIAYITAMPCADCARALIQSGINTIILPESTIMDDEERTGRWKDSWEASKKMFVELGIEIRTVEVEPLKL